MAVPNYLNDPAQDTSTDQPVNIETQDEYGNNPAVDPLDSIASTSEYGGDLESGVVDGVANHYNRSGIFENFLQGAIQGKDTTAQINELKQYKKAKELELSQLKIKQANTDPYDQAMQAFGQEIGNSPDAPDMVAPHVGNTEKLIGLAAILLGGAGVAPEVIKGLVAGANTQANQENQRNQNKYSILSKKHQDKVAQLRFDAQTKGQRLDREDTNNIREFQAKDRALGGQIDDFENEIKTREALDQKDAATAEKNFNLSLDRASKKVQELFTAKGGWSKENDQWLRNEAGRIAFVHHAKDATDQDILEYSGQIYKHLARYAPGDITAKQANSDRNFTFKVDKNKWDQEFKGKTFQQRQEMFDKKFNEQVRQFEQSYGRNITNDEYRKAYQTGMMEISRGREERLSGTLPEDGTPKPTLKPPTPSQKSAGLKEIAALEKEMESFPDDPDRYTPEQKTKEERKAFLDEWIRGVSPSDADGNKDNGFFGIKGAIRDIKGARPPAKRASNGKPVQGKSTKAPKGSGTQGPITKDHPIKSGTTKSGFEFKMKGK